MAGIVGNSGQCHERGNIALHAFGDGFGLTAQSGLLALDAAVEQLGIQGIKGIGNRQRHHEVPAAVADQSFDIALVVAFGRPPEFIVEQVVALQLGKFLGALALAIAQDLGHRDPGVVVQDRLRYAMEKGKGGDMPVQKGFGIFRRVGFDEAPIRMRQVEAEIMEAHLFAADVAIGLAEINLGMAGPVRERNEHFLLAGGDLVDVIAHDGVAAGEPMLIPQPLQNADRGVALFDMHLLVGFENGVDEAGESGELGRDRFALALIARRHGELADLLDGLAMDAEQAGGFPLAALVDHHGASYFDVEFH